MNRSHGADRFSTRLDVDNHEGYVALDLFRMSNGAEVRVARVVFWDASGQFFVETFGSDVPLEVFEELIVEAKSTIKTA